MKYPEKFRKEVREMLLKRVVIVCCVTTIALFIGACVAGYYIETRTYNFALSLIPLVLPFAVFLAFIFFAIKTETFLSLLNEKGRRVFPFSAQRAVYRMLLEEESFTDGYSRQDIDYYLAEWALLRKGILQEGPILTLAGAQNVVRDVWRRHEEEIPSPAIEGRSPFRPLGQSLGGTIILSLSNPRGTTLLTVLHEVAHELALVKDGGQGHDIFFEEWAFRLFEEEGLLNR